MTDGISNSGPVKPAYTQPARTRAADARPTSTAAATSAADGDRVELSDTVQQLQSEPGFDPAKVARIRQAIASGNYPLDPRRMAESFVGLEQMFDKATGGQAS